MITFLIIYWIFAGLVTLGVIYENSKITLLSIIFSLIFGGILFPMKLGTILENIHEIARRI